jgi:WD40 repeat protein
MTNKTICLVQRVVVVAACVLLSQSFLYSQTVNSEIAPAFVRLRLSIDLNKPRRVIFSAASKLLAVQGEDGSVHIIDITDGREQTVLPLADKAPYSMHWTKDGLRLLIVTSQSAALWDARLGTRLSPLIEIRRNKYFYIFDEVKLSENEKLLLNIQRDDSFKATVFGWERPKVQVWSLESGQLKFEIKIKGIQSHAELSPNGKQILTTSEKGDPKLWDVETGRLFATLKPPLRPLFREGSEAEFSPDGRFVIQTHETGTYIWHSSSGALNTRIPFYNHSGDSSFKGFTPDGKMFARLQQTLGRHAVNSIELRDCETGELRSTLTAPKWDDWPTEMLWSDDGRTFLATSGYNKYQARIWDVDTGKFKATIPLVITYSRIPFDWGFKDRDQLAMHPTLPVLSAANSKLARLWNVDTGELMQTLDSNGGYGEWTADGKLFLTFMKDRKAAQVWEVVGPEQSRLRSKERYSARHRACFSCI